jgi:hypothetical protein
VGASVLRVLAATISLAGAAVVVGWWERKPSATHGEHAFPPPWIALPSTTSDAALIEVREALFLAADQDPDTALARSCGLHGVDQTYVAHIADDGESARWRIQLVVHGDRLQTLVAAATPPMPVEGGASSKMPPRTQWFDKQELGAFASAWREEALWEAPQKHAFCHFTDILTLEACVGGRYAVRERSCDVDAIDAARRFRRIAHQLFDLSDPARK